MGALIAMFSGPFGAILTKIIEGLFILGVLIGLYYLIHHQASSEQLAKDQQIILNQVIKDQQDFINKTNQLLIDTKKANDDLNTTIATINQNFTKLNDDLNNPDLIKSDRPASAILKQIIKDLGGK